MEDSGHAVILLGLKSLFQLLENDLEGVISLRQFMKETCTHEKWVAREPFKGTERQRQAGAYQLRRNPSGGGGGWVKIHPVSQLGWSLESIQNGVFQTVGRDPLGECNQIN